MPDFNSSIYVCQPDLRAPSTQLTPHVVTYEAVIVGVQSEIVIDASVHRCGFEVRFSV
jgi:hypothetical protein